MIKYYQKKRNEPLKELKGLEKGCWINIYPPFDKEKLEKLSDLLDVPLDFFIDSLDIDERSRYETEDGVQLVVVNIPIRNKLKTSRLDAALYITIPIGIVEVDHYILTISSFENPVIDYFLNQDVKKFDTSEHSYFVLLLFERSVHYFLRDLKSINNQRDIYEKELFHSSRNSELSKLMNLQKSLVYFVTTLRGNELMLQKMQRTDFLNIRKDEEADDFFEDILIDMSQAQEMSQIYSDILNSTMDAFASIISNNLNTIMKRLTSVTIVLMVPTLVASFYGMNVPLWGEGKPYAFVVILFVAFILTFMLIGFFMRKRLI